MGILLAIQSSFLTIIISWTVFSEITPLLILCTKGERVLPWILGCTRPLMEVITFYTCTCNKTLILRDDSNAQVTSCLRSFMNQSFNLFQENSESEPPTNTYCACFGSLNNENIYNNEQVTFCAQCHHNDMENFYSLPFAVKPLLTHLRIGYSCWLQWNYYQLEVEIHYLGRTIQIIFSQTPCLSHSSMLLFINNLLLLLLLLLIL